MSLPPFLPPPPSVPTEIPLLAPQTREGGGKGTVGDPFLLPSPGLLHALKAPIHPYRKKGKREREKKVPLSFPSCFLPSFRPGGSHDGLDRLLRVDVAWLLGWSHHDDGGGGGGGGGDGGDALAASGLHLSLSLSLVFPPSFLLVVCRVLLLLCPRFHLFFPTPLLRSDSALLLGPRERK